MRVSRPSVACRLSSCGPPPCPSTVLMPTWCSIATCSIRPRVEVSSLNTAPPALMTNTLFLYMRMYGAALFRARTATDGSGRLMIIGEYSDKTLIQASMRCRTAICTTRRLKASRLTTARGPSRTSSATATLRRTGRQCMSLASGNAGANQRSRKYTSGRSTHRQTIQELRVGQRRCEPALAHAPVRQVAPQAKIGLDVAVIGGGAPLLGVQHTGAGELRCTVGSLGDGPAGRGGGQARLLHDLRRQCESVRPCDDDVHAPHRGH